MEHWAPRAVEAQVRRPVLTSGEEPTVPIGAPGRASVTSVPKTHSLTHSFNKSVLGST